MKKNEIPVAQNNDFDGLVVHIQQTQDVLQNNARLVINRHVTANHNVFTFLCFESGVYSKAFVFI